MSKGIRVYIITSSRTEEGALTQPLTRILMEWMFFQSHCFFDFIQAGLLNRLHSHTQTLAVPLILSISQSGRHQGSVIHTLAR